MSSVGALGAPVVSIVLGTSGVAKCIGPTRGGGAWWERSGVQRWLGLAELAAAGTLLGLAGNLVVDGAILGLLGGFSGFGYWAHRRFRGARRCSCLGRYGRSTLDVLHLIGLALLVVLQALALVAGVEDQTWVHAVEQHPLIGSALVAGMSAVVLVLVGGRTSWSRLDRLARRLVRLQSRSARLEFARAQLVASPAWRFLGRHFVRVDGQAGEQSTRVVGRYVLFVYEASFGGATGTVSFAVDVTTRSTAGVLMAGGMEAVWAGSPRLRARLGESDLGAPGRPALAGVGS